MISTEETADRKRGGRNRRKRKFYEMGPNFTGGVMGLVLDNKQRLITPKHLTIGPEEGKRGFPDYPEPPRFRYDRKRGRLPRDIELFSAYWLVSEKMRAVLVSTDPDAFAFLRCELVLGDGSSGPAYWLCDVLRILDALDETASDVQIGYQEERKTYWLPGATRLVFREEAVGAAHVFRMARVETCIICDDTMREACKAADLKGMSFSAAVKS